MKKIVYCLLFLSNLFVSANESPISKIISYAVKKLEHLPNHSFLLLDVKNILNETHSVQPNKYYYESGNNFPMDFEQFTLWKSSLENTLSNFNQSQNDSLRIYVVAIKNLELLLPLKLDIVTNDTNSNLFESLDRIKKCPRELAQLYKIFGSIIKGISQQSQWHTAVLGVGHFYVKNSSKTIEHYFSKYLELKNQGPLSNATKRNELRTIIQNNLKDAPNDNPISTLEQDVVSLIENINCSLYGKCENLSFPIEIEGQGIFSDVVNSSPTNSDEISIGQSSIELIDLCNIVPYSTLQNKLNEWSIACQQQELKLKVCISSYDNHANALRQINYFRNNLPDNCIFIWYHKRADGRMLCDFRLSENINHTIFQKVEREKRKKLIFDYIRENGTAQSFLEFIPSAFVKVIADFLEEQFTIPEHYYIKSDPSYSTLYKSILFANLPENTQQTFAQLTGSSLINGVNPILIPDLGFAFACGIYNAIIENSSGTFRAIEIFNNSDRIKLLAESLKNFFSVGTDSLFHIISNEFKANYLSDNIYKRAYYSGKLTVNVLSCFVGIGEINALCATGKLSVEFNNASKMINLLKHSVSKLTTSGLKLGGSVLALGSKSGKWVLHQLKNPIGEIVANPKNYASKIFQFSSQEINSLFTNGFNSKIKKTEEIFDGANEKIGCLYQDVNTREIVYAGKDVWKATLQIGSRIDAYVKLLEKDVSLPQWIKASFKDQIYYTVETTQKIKLFRDFGDQAFLDGSFCTSINNATRENLAIHPSFNNSMRFKAELEVPIGEKINIGKAGPYPPGDANALPGGEEQILLKTNYDHGWIKTIKDTQTGEIMSLAEFKEKYPQLLKTK